jgi:hypothetical protein
MKRNAVFFYMLIVTAILGNAQAIDRSRYREITLPQFEEWKQGVPREGTEPILFKARVTFEEVSETTISFAAPDNQTSIYFTADRTWPEMEEGRPVLIYFTASGAWSWNRVLDGIDNGSTPAGDPSVDDLATAGAAAAPDPADEAAADLAYEQYDDQAGYDEEEEADAFEGQDQENFPAEPEADKEPEADGPGDRDISPQQPPPPAPPARPSVSRSPAPSVKITGAAPRPGRVYRLQVGAFTVEGNAARALSRLKDAGFNPRYEESGQYLRVVLSGVRAADVKAYAERIGRAGFSEIWCREER